MQAYALPLGHLAAWTYPALVLLALLGASAWALWRAPDARISRRALGWRLVAMGGAGILAAKLGHLLLEAEGHVDAQGRVIHGVLELLRADPWHFFRFADGGFVLLPGFLGGALLLWFFVKRLKMSWGVYADLLAPASLLGLAIGRIACLLAGCCHGRASTLPWAIRFHGGPSLGLGFVQPTQIYASLWALLLFVFAAGLWRRSLRNKTAAGAVALVTIIAYGLGRMGLELLRGDVERGFWLHGWLSSSQVICAILIAVSTGALWRQRGRGPSLTAPVNLQRELS